MMLNGSWEWCCLTASSSRLLQHASVVRILLGLKTPNDDGLCLQYNKNLIQIKLGTYLFAAKKYKDLYTQQRRTLLDTKYANDTFTP